MSSSHSNSLRPFAIMMTATALSILSLGASSGTIVTQGENLTISYVTPNGEYTVSYQMQRGYDW